MQVAADSCTYQQHVLALHLQVVSSGDTNIKGALPASALQLLQKGQLVGDVLYRSMSSNCDTSAADQLFTLIPQPVCSTAFFVGYTFIWALD